MRGFTDKALILFPSLEVFDDKPKSWKTKFKESVERLDNYLQSVEIVPHYLYTDDIGRIHPMSNTVWLSPVVTADKFFMSRKCTNMENAMSIPMLEFPDICEEVVRKDPGAPKMTDVERFQMVLRHTDAACRKILPQYNLIFHFLKKSKAQYRVVSRPNDEKIRINIDVDTLTSTCLVSGVDTDIGLILNKYDAHRPVYLWEECNVQEPTI